MKLATHSHSHLDIEGDSLLDATGKDHDSATPSPCVVRTASHRWSIIASVASVLLVVGMAATASYGGEHELDKSGMDMVSLVGEQEAWTFALEASKELVGPIVSAIKDINSNMKQTRQELEAMSSKRISIAEDKLEQFTGKMATTTALLLQVESDSQNMYSNLADIFQLNVDDLKVKLYTDDFETQQQAIRDAKDTIQAAVDTALLELAPLQAKLSAAQKDFAYLSQTSGVFQGHLARDERGQSEWYNHQASDLRTKAYCGCIASVVGGPVGLAACYGTAAGVLENYLSDLKQEVREVKERMRTMGALFGKLGAQCSALGTRALRDYHSMGKVKSKLELEKVITNPPAVTFWKSRVLPTTKKLVALLREKASE